ncbi:MAG: glycosyltransferase family 2 protein [Verrucomicrobia bacterium]|nr:glycosyltransferase family 2 protein [Verrucomicrobiota bacterium]
MKVSIITATYNKLELTQAFWASLVSYPPDVEWEMIWVDDGSTDGTREWLRTQPAALCRSFFNDKNLGYAGANNLGATHATGDILAFLNNDLVLTDGWFPPLCNILQNSSGVGIVGNVQLSTVTDLIDHAGVRFDLVGVPVHHLKNRPRGALRGNGCLSKAVTAACWLVNRTVFLENGGFDESYRNGSEDIDLCIRLGNAGYRHWVDYRSVIWHHVSSSPGRKTYDLQNQARFLKQWSHVTLVWGQVDWPRAYLSRILRNPGQLNLTKAFDALLRVMCLRRGDSDWAAKRRQKLMNIYETKAKVVAEVAS